MNIRFKSIRISHFLSILNGEVDFENQGLTCIKGINLETNPPQSNGSGKSSIFDAILWTLTGETFRGTADVVNEKSYEGCFCELTLSVDKDDYKIVRSKEHPEYGNSVFFYKNEELLSDTTKKSQELINKSIMISSSEIIGSIIILGQGLPNKFTSLSPIKRKELLETMSGMDSQVSEFLQKLSDKESEYQKLTDKITLETTKTLGEISGLESSLRTLQGQLDLYGKSFEISSKIVNLKMQKEELESQLPSLREEKDSLQREYNGLVKSRNSVSEYLSTQKGTLTYLTKELSGLNKDVCPTCKRPFEVTDEILAQRKEVQDKINATNSQIELLENKYKTLYDLVVNKDTELTEKVNIINSTNIEIRRISEEIDSKERVLKTSGSLSDKIAEVENQIREKSIQNTDNSDKLTKYLDTVTQIEVIKRLLSREFKGYLLTSVIDYLSTQSEYYGNYLFHLDSKVNVSLSGNKILVKLGNRLYENLSGGERQRVDLSVQFALRDMLMTTSGFFCNILVLDEVFDNLDAQGEESLIQLIISELSDIESVYIITHHSDIPIPYDNTITVTKDTNGVSTITK